MCVCVVILNEKEDSNVINRVLQFEEGQQCVLVWSYSMRRKDGNVINRVLQFEEGQQCVFVWSYSMRRKIAMS